MLRACGAALLGHGGLGAIGLARGFASSAAASAAVKVGLIGLGRIGGRFVPRLLDAGHEVVLHDKNKLAVNRMLEVGKAHPAGTVTVKGSPAELAATEGVGVVLTVLPDPAALNSVFLGHDGLLAAKGGLRASLFVNVSTVDPETITRLAGAVRAAPLAPGAAPLSAAGRPALLDAPATGGVVGAQAGEMCFCVGADDAKDIEAARPVLELLGNHITHCGPVGTGSVAKLCNALVMSASMTAVAEALALGKRLNVDPAVLTDVLNSGSGRWAGLGRGCGWRCPGGLLVMQRSAGEDRLRALASHLAGEKYSPAPGVVKGAPSNQGYKPGQQVDQVRDQLLMLIRAGERIHSPTPCAKFNEEVYRALHDEGLGDKDFSSVYRYRYGSGCDNPEWKEGQQLYSSQIP